MSSSTTVRLFLILVLSATIVTCQKVYVSKVTTSALVVTWERQGEWADVGTFNVDLQVNGAMFCSKTVLCFLTNTCTFRSENNCNKFQQCSRVNVTVSGGGHDAPQVTATTAPDPVSDLQVTSSGNTKQVSWTNPASTCLRDTTASVTYSDYYHITSVLPPSLASFTVPVCNKGSGKVVVSTRGGDGESEGASRTFARLIGEDTVTVTSCAPQGCTGVVVQWEYKDVCYNVTTLRVTIGPKTFTTNDLALDNTTFTDLMYDTQYNTCVYALDADGVVMAAHCTTCGTYPEVVEDLKVVNVSDTTIEMAWTAPKCPTGDNIVYNISFSSPGISSSNTTTRDTKFVWAGTLPAVTYDVCVLVQHPDVIPDHDPACVKTTTLPAAPEEVSVQVYKEKSLFVSWDGALITPNLKYRVSWGKELQHHAYTEYKSYTIDGYNETAGPSNVCVQTEMKEPAGLISTKSCREQPFPTFGDYSDKVDPTAMIVSVSVSSGMAVLLTVVLVGVAKMKGRT